MGNTVAILSQFKDEIDQRFSDFLRVRVDSGVIFKDFTQ